MSGPQSDEAPAAGTAWGFRDHDSTNTDHCADPAEWRKRVAQAKARAASIGLKLAPLHDGAWALVDAASDAARHVRTAQSLKAAEAALCAFEQVHSEVRALLEAAR